MTIQHTPGPWEAKNFHIWGQKDPQSRHPGGRILIALVMHGNHKEDPGLSNGAHDPEAIADCRLIAAAPAMLKALQKCADKFREYEQLHIGKGSLVKAAHNDEMASMAESVIAKATGQEVNNGIK